VKYRYDRATITTARRSTNLTLPAACLSGEWTLASLDERTLRRRPVVFGLATIALLPLLVPAIGRTAVAAGAFLMALSPAMVFYSRMYIQESLFTCFVLAFVIGHRPDDDGRRAGVVGGGGLAGNGGRDEGDVMIVLPPPSSRAPPHGCHSGRAPSTIADEITWWAAGLGIAAAVAALFFSSFWRPPGRARAVRRHRHVPPPRRRPGEPRAPLALLPEPAGVLLVRGLRWSEGVILVLAIVGW